jgi:hypothetical protein
MDWSTGLFVTEPSARKELVWIKVDPRFDALRHDTRFQQFVETVFPAN